MASAWKGYCSCLRFGHLHVFLHLDGTLILHRIFEREIGFHLLQIQSLLQTSILQPQPLVASVEPLAIPQEPKVAGFIGDLGGPHDGDPHLCPLELLLQGFAFPSQFC